MSASRSGFVDRDSTEGTLTAGGSLLLTRIVPSGQRFWIMAGRVYNVDTVARTIYVYYYDKNTNYCGTLVTEQSVPASSWVDFEEPLPIPLDAGMKVRAYYATVGGGTTGTAQFDMLVKVEMI